MTVQRARSLDDVLRLAEGVCYPSLPVSGLRMAIQAGSAARQRGWLNFNIDQTAEPPHGRLGLRAGHGRDGSFRGRRLAQA